MAEKDNSHWMEDAAASMRRRGTEGSFGKATSKNIKRGLAKGGKMAKKAAFAKAAKSVASRH